MQGVVSGVVPYILTDQLTLSQPGGADYGLACLLSSRSMNFFSFFLDRPEYTRKFLAHFVKSRTYLRLKAQIIRMKEEITEKLLKSKKKRQAAQAKKAAKTNTAVKPTSSNIGMTARDFKQRAYFST